MCTGGISILGTFTPFLNAIQPTPASVVTAAAALARHVVTDTERHPPILLCAGHKGRLVVKEVLDPAKGIKSAVMKDLSALHRGIVCIWSNVQLPVAHIPCKASDDLREVETDCVAAIEPLFSKAVLRMSGPHDSVVVTSRDDDTVFADAMGWQLNLVGNKKNVTFQSRQPVNAELLFPLGGDDLSAKPSKDDTDKVVRLSGTMFVQAVVMQDCTLGDLLEAVRSDMLSSLKVRLQLLAEIDEDNEEDEIEHDTPALYMRPGCRALPARVLATPINETPTACLPMSEYILAEETVDDDVTSRFMEILPWNQNSLEQYKIEQKEQFLLLTDNPSSQAKVANVPPIKNIASLSTIDTDDTVQPFPDLFYTTFACIVAVAFLAMVIKEILYYI